jgi:hypothetical protein
MKRIVVAPVMLLALLVGTVACASSGEGSSGRDLNVLLPEEIQEAPVSNLYDAVNQLRPRWLQVRSVTSLGGGAADIAVFQGTSYIGNSEALRSMGLDGVARLRYLDGPLAQAQLRAPQGVQMPGAIVVEYDR